MTRSARLLDLLQALRRRRRPVSAAVLAQELGVSIRTVYRDVATLIAQGAPIEGEAGLGYVLRPGFDMPPLMFTSEEVDALVLGLSFVSRRGDTELERAAADALTKIAAVLPDALEDAAGAGSLRAGPAKAREPAHLATIRRALAAEERVSLDYVDKKGSGTRRVVWPIVLGFFEGYEMLAAWCETRRDFRHFRLDRIRSAEATGERYPKRRRILLAEWQLTQDFGD